MAGGGKRRAYFREAGTVSFGEESGRKERITGGPA